MSTRSSLKALQFSMTYKPRAPTIPPITRQRAKLYIMSSWYPSRRAKAVATPTPMITPSAVKRPCQVTSIPQLLKITGSMPMSIESSIVSIIVLHNVPCRTCLVGQAPQLAGITRVGRCLAGHQRASRGNFSPKPASRHPERRCQPGDDQRRARPDQIVAAVSLDRDAGELALTEKAVLVITHPDALALVELDGLGFEAGECQQGRSRRC